MPLFADAIDAGAFSTTALLRAADAQAEEIARQEARELGRAYVPGAGAGERRRRDAELAAKYQADLEDIALGNAQRAELNARTRAHNDALEKARLDYIAAQEAESRTFFDDIGDAVTSIDPLDALQAGLSVVGGPLAGMAISALRDVGEGKSAWDVAVGAASAGYGSTLGAYEAVQNTSSNPVLAAAWRMEQEKIDGTRRAIGGIARGEGVDKALLAGAKTFVSTTKTGLSFVPGVSQGLSAALAAADALVHGRPIDAAMLDALRASLPGGPVVQRGFDAGRALITAALRGESVTSAMVEALRASLPKEARAAFEAGYALARGESITQAYLKAGRVMLPADADKLARAAFDAAEKALTGRPLAEVGFDLVRQVGPDALRTWGPGGSFRLPANLDNALRSAEGAYRDVERHAEEAAMELRRLSPTATVRPLALLTQTAPAALSSLTGSAATAAQALLRDASLRGLPIEDAARKLNVPLASAKEAVGALASAAARTVPGAPSPALSRDLTIERQLGPRDSVDSALSRFGGSRTAPNALSPSPSMLGGAAAMGALVTRTQAQAPSALSALSSSGPKLVKVSALGGTKSQAAAHSKAPRWRTLSRSLLTMLVAEVPAARFLATEAPASLALATLQSGQDTGAVGRAPSHPTGVWMVVQAGQQTYPVKIAQTSTGNAALWTELNPLNPHVAGDWTRIAPGDEINLPAAWEAGARKAGWIVQSAAPAPRPTSAPTSPTGPVPVMPSAPVPLAGHPPGAILQAKLLLSFWTKAERQGDYGVPNDFAPELDLRFSTYLVKFKRWSEENDRAVLHDGTTGAFTGDLDDDTYQELYRYADDWAKRNPSTPPPVPWATPAVPGPAPAPTPPWTPPGAPPELPPWQGPSAPGPSPDPGQGPARPVPLPVAAKPTGGGGALALAAAAVAILGGFL